MKVGCPAISWDLATMSTPPGVKIDPAVCSGCTICAQLCPSRAIVSVRDEKAGDAKAGDAKVGDGKVLSLAAAPAETGSAR
jgi:TPP-dependent indolepyruvate ferredoxin oxidoreductase alpha subunit